MEKGKQEGRKEVREEGKEVRGRGKGRKRKKKEKRERDKCPALSRLCHHGSWDLLQHLEALLFQSPG